MSSLTSLVSQISLIHSENAQRYEKDLKNLSNDYKTYVLKSKEWLETNEKRKEEWRIERAMLIQQVGNLKDMVSKNKKEIEILPEMLSPEETVEIVIGVFRSGEENEVVQALRRKEEFNLAIKRFANFSENEKAGNSSLNTGRHSLRKVIVDRDTLVAAKSSRNCCIYESPREVNRSYSSRRFAFPY